MAYDYDLVVVGFGPAGEMGAAQASYLGNWSLERHHYDALGKLDRPS